MDELEAAAAVEATPMLVDEEDLKPANGDASTHDNHDMSDVVAEDTHAPNTKQGSGWPINGERMLHMHPIPRTLKCSTTP